MPTGVKVIAPGPKRRIERAYTTINSDLTTSTQDISLHTCEDAKTLVRMRGHLVFSSTESTGAGQSIYDAAIHVAPGGTSTLTVSGSSLTDQVSNRNRIASQHGSVFGSWDGTRIIALRDDVWEFDIKAMRKMQEGDILRLSYIGASGVEIKMTGIVDMWFKE